MQKFKEGQKVKVVKRKMGHKFKIGDVVEVIFPDPMSNNGDGDYKCSNGFKDWYLVDEELEAIE